MSFEIDLVRHGETVAAGVLLGRTDAALSERGERQMRGHASRCRWDRVVAAPLGRAQASARLLAGPDQAIETVAGWAELDFGDWDGRAIASLDPADYQRYVEDPRHHAPPGGEAISAAVERVSAALADLADCQPAARTAVVTHAGTIRIALSITTGLDFAALWRLRIGPGARLRLRYGRDAAGGWWGEIVELVQPSWCDP